jgi:hypothetical protein
MINARRRATLWVIAALTAALALPAAAQADQFTISGPGIAIPDDGTNNTSTITVSGFTGTITHATASFASVVHPNGADIDAAIVAPNGVAVSPMGDSCQGAISESLTFTDSALTGLPAVGPCNAGPYKPTNAGGADDPVPGATTTLSSFNGVDPNGTWTLVLADDTMNALTGSVGGWSLTLDGLGVVTTTTSETPPGNPTSPVNPAGNIRKRKCKKKQKTAGAEIAKRKKCHLKKKH